MRLSGETALVTGASRGIGRAIAVRLRAEGAEVIGTATSEAGLARIAALADEPGPRIDAALLDVAQDASVAALIDRLAEQAREPSILVNNAGITRDGLLMRMSNDDWDAVIATNLSSLHRLCSRVVRQMLRARRGRIINVTSVVGLAGNAGQTNYAASKAGIIGFTRALAREVASRGITVNAVAPGFIETDMTDALSESQRAALTAQIPLGRLGTPADVAAVVAFLASADAAYLTGQTLSVNGGMLMP